MRRLLFLSFATALFSFCAISSFAGQQDSPRRKTPKMTTEDARPIIIDQVEPEVTIIKSDASGTALRNARTMLQSTLGKMSAVNSARTRMMVTLPTGAREVTIESVKPDRARIQAAEGEVVLIGRKLYTRNAGGDWQVIAMPSAGPSAAAGGFDFQMFLKKMLSESKVQVTGQVLGDERIDDTDTVAYEFTITDNTSKSGVLQICVGKQDGFARRLFLIGPDVDLKIWFTNINEPLSIEAPI